MNLGTRKQAQILWCVLYMSASYTRDSTVLKAKVHNISAHCARSGSDTLRTPSCSCCSVSHTAGEVAPPTLALSMRAGLKSSHRAPVAPERRCTCVMSVSTAARSVSGVDTAAEDDHDFSGFHIGDARSFS